MPRKALVSVEDAVAVIEKFFDHFGEGRYPEWSSDIWKQMSDTLDNRWSGDNVYNNVTKNRRKITETACFNKGLPFIPFQGRCNKSTFDLSTLYASTRLDDSDSPYNYEQETVGLDYFEVRITPAEWTEMREPDTTYNDNRTYPILHRNIWTDTLAIAIDRQMELPCAFVFDKSKIYETPGSLHYMRITGFCKSGSCRNPLYCYLYEKPAGDCDFNIIVRTRDTLHDKHDKVERPLRGIRRQRVGEEVFNEGSTNWHKRQFVANTRFGGRIPSHIPKPNILDQAKKQYVDRKLGIKSSDGKDLIKTIEEMTRSAPYLGFIHEVKRDKFYVSFSTPAQLHAYKQYCRTTKGLSSVCVDGTGGISLPLTREDGSPSGHIFLYSITINFNGTTVSVFDWLSESQDTDIIFWAIKQWLKLGAPKPREVVCDSSRALMNGLSLALNYQTVKVYVETCFLYASGNPEYPYRSPIYTYLRLDVAHLMIMVRRWKCFEHMRHTVVRQFYLYCIGLMIDCQTLEQFKEIFQLTCIVGVNEFQDSIIESCGQSVLSSRRTLEERIVTRNFDLNFESSTYHDNGTTSEGNEEEDSTDNGRTKKYISDLRNRAEVIAHEGSESNLFFFPDFIERFMSLAYEFPLWSAVAIPHVAEHASSAFVEGHFNIIKHSVLKNYSGRLRVDKFLKLIVNDYSGSAANATSKLKVFNQNDGSYPTPLMKPNVFLPRESKEITQASGSTLLPFEVQNLGSCETKSTTNGNTHPKSNPDQRNTGIANVDDCAVGMDDRFMENINIEVFRDRFQEPDADVASSDNPAAIEASVQNQPKLEANIAKGKYFKPNPGIQRRNNLATNVQQSSVLRNGSLVTNPARIDGSSYFAYNTCGFDSLIQILSASVMDDPEYLSYVQKSTNQILQFLLSFIENGPSADIYKQRIILLKNLFESKIEANYDHCGKLKSYSIDVFGSLNTTWTTCFESEPSAQYLFQCPKCDIYSSPVSTLSVNHKIIGDQGFGALQEALVLNNLLSCIDENCTELCQVELVFNAQIFIELDIRPNLGSSKGLTCKLRDFPLQLSLNGVEYRLAGVVERLPGHYVAYCRRVNNRWEMCNDTNSKIIHSGPNTLIEPHGVLYIESTSHERVVNDSSESFGTSAPKLSSSDAVFSVGDDNNNNHEEIPFLPDRWRFPTTVPLDDSDTTSRDNWRNKEDVQDICFGPSLDETAEDNISTAEPTFESTRSDISNGCGQLAMLQAGNILPGIIIDEDIFHLRNTDNFDSTVHILRCSALDETLYMAAIKKSANETFRFTLDLIESKSHQDIYLKRAALLKSLYSSKISEEVGNDIVQYTINLIETPTRTWATCLVNEPSVWREYVCKSCKTYVLPMPVLTVDPNVIARKGFVALEKALLFYKTLKKVKCQQEHCLELCTVTAYPNFHFYIECNVTSSDRSRTRSKCRLQDFPTTLCLKGQPGRYRLKGILAQTSDHIAAYCLRANDEWELYHSSAMMTPNIHPSEVIEPYGATFISIS